MFTSSSYFLRNNNAMKWNMLSSDNNILIKTCENLKKILPEDLVRNSLTKIAKINIE